MLQLKPFYKFRFNIYVLVYVLQHSNLVGHPGTIDVDELELAFLAMLNEGPPLHFNYLWVYGFRLPSQCLAYLVEGHLLDWHGNQLVL